MQILGKSESEIKDLVRQGKLREFRDGPKVVYKKEDVDGLSDDFLGIDLLPETGELDVKLDKTAEIDLEPDKDAPKSEGGFGLSQIGSDLTNADTNVGTIGINILAETDDKYKISSDTRAETKIASKEEVESLDADANLESIGSGSGLLDLSLQADDTSLGAVLDDILPTGPDIPPQSEVPAAMVDENAVILENEDRERPSPMAAASRVMQAAAPVAPAAPQMTMVMPEDPTSSIYGTAMFLPLIALVIASIATAAGVKDIFPSLVKMLTHTGVADYSLVWLVITLLTVVFVIFMIFAMLSAGKKTAPDVYQKK